VLDFHQLPATKLLISPISHSRHDPACSSFIIETYICN
jgi:hypothetical protein